MHLTSRITQGGYHEVQEDYQSWHLQIPKTQPSSPSDSLERFLHWLQRSQKQKGVGSGERRDIFRLPALQGPWTPRPACLQQTSEVPAGPALPPSDSASGPQVLRFNNLGEMLDQ